MTCPHHYLLNYSFSYMFFVKIYITMGQSFFKEHCNNADVVRMLITVVSLVVCLCTADAKVGVNYGTLGNNLPPPAEVLTLCKNNNIKSIRIFDPNPSILEALSNFPDISVMVGVKNLDIPAIAKDPNAAKSWVENNVLKYAKANIAYIAVGNEVELSPKNNETASIAPSIAPAMQNIFNAISAAGLGQKIKVSTAFSTLVGENSYPPSATQFRPAMLSSFLDPIIKFLIQTEAPLLMNLYPYLAHKGDPDNIKLDYALFKSPTAVVTDGEYQYYNLFSAMVDSFYVALEKAGAANVGIVVTETGWPSYGATAASLENAQTYNNNLIKFVEKGTPRRPGKPIETYIFDLIDENEKSSEFEKHWGLFHPDKQLKYSISFP